MVLDLLIEIEGLAWFGAQRRVGVNQEESSTSGSSETWWRVLKISLQLGHLQVILYVLLIIPLPKIGVFKGLQSSEAVYWFCGCGRLRWKEVEHSSHSCRGTRMIWSGVGCPEVITTLE
jgi:hypothetical protein